MAVAAHRLKPSFSRLADIVAIPPLKQVEAIRKGLPIAIFDLIAETLDIGKEPFARKLKINAQTLRKRQSQVISPSETEKSLRAIRVFVSAAEVLGGEKEARQWMQARRSWR